MNTPRISSKIVVYFLILGLLASSASVLSVINVNAQPSTLTFIPVADAYVISTYPNTNDGIATNLRVDSSPTTRSYVRFVVSGLNGGTVQSAKIRLYANSSNTTGYSVKSLFDNTWTENGITYNNAPAPGNLLGTSPAVVAGKWIEVDITSYINGDGTYNLVLDTTSSTNTSFGSRESGANAPQLVVTFAPIEPTATETLPPATATPAASGAFTFTSAADAYVISTYPNTNDGIATNLRVDDSPITRSYLRFIVSGLNGAPIVSAKIRLYANSSNTTGYSVKSLSDNTWTETGITYNNAPAPGSLLGTSPAVVAGNWIEVDISSYFNGDGTYNLVLDTTSSTNTSFGSRESGADAPQLVITYGAAGPTPTQSSASPTATGTQIPTTPTLTQPANSNTPTDTAAPATPTLTKPASSPTATKTLVPATPTLTKPVASATPTHTPSAPTPTPSSGLTPVNLTKGPDLIYPGSNTAIEIFWQWNATTPFTVAWGTNTSYSLGNAPVSAYDTTNHLYKYTITGLTPGTKYYYRVVVGSQYSAGTFYTSPAASATSLKFVSYGDTRSNPTQHDSVAAEVISLYQSDPGYQTLLPLTGDLVSSGDTDSLWNSEFFSPTYTHIRTELANVAVEPIMGNHEGSGGLFVRYWPEPYVAARYYSFDYGPVHFTMIDQYTSYTAGSAQYNWIKSDLAASTKTWKVAVFHEPGWSANGGHPDNTTVQTALEPLFEQYKVALVLTGHNHYYARAMVNGIAELTIGTGGAPAYTPLSGQPDVVYTYKGLGYCKFSISGSTLTGWFVDGSNTVRDTFTVSR
ncbi:MAG: DNRLRE domain-containing protein [Anaerolineaceae bacterium]|nr:DNRLRE domain-containing protein [Anaerolineaceae bacterium]